jgi:siroheme synthase (precorrin-2 oxidase/ferrochelatase)
MNTAAHESLTAHSNHVVATNRSLDTLLAWSAEIAQGEAAVGRKVIYAPCHALMGALSLRSWILSNAHSLLGGVGPDDGMSLLSGSCDTLILADPASADAASLHWLGDLYACADAAADVAPAPPLPRLVMLVPVGSDADPRVAELLTRMNALGSREERIAGRPGDATPAMLETEFNAQRGRYAALLAALALMPCPLEIPQVEKLARDARAGQGAVAALTSGHLFRVIGTQFMPANAEVIRVLRGGFSADELQAGAQLMLGLLETELTDLPDARVEVLLYAGDSRRAVKLARKHFDEHVDAEQYEEALRVLRAAIKLGITLDSGKYAEEIDQARLAAMCAQVQQHREAQALVDTLSRRRELFHVGPFIEWLSIGARRLAIDTGFEPRMADSLMRRAIRLLGDDTDAWVRLRLLRVELLRSPGFNLEERADWLLSHVSNKILDKVSQKTLASYLDEVANRQFAKGDFKGAFKRLRRLGALPTTLERLGRAMLLMARCRSHFRDFEAAHRYASSALHYGMRAARPAIVDGAAEFLRTLEKDRPRRLPKLVPPAKPRGQRPRLPAAADIPTPQSAEASQLFELLESRFRVLSWVRRRGSVENYGEPDGDMTDSLTIYQEIEGGEVTRIAVCGEFDEIRGLVLMRRDGSDFITYRVDAESDGREDAIVQFLLTDRAADASDAPSGSPARKAVVDEYMRRALSQGLHRGLHHTMETMFNKDVLIFFEEQGFSKEEMAEKLGVSRATLYRMFARAGLN